MTQSNANGARCKPDKPFAGYPLFPHASGQWPPKINKRLCYFGKWDDLLLYLYKPNRGTRWRGNTEKVG